MAEEKKVTTEGTQPVDTPTPIVPRDPVFINTRFGTVTVYGQELIGKRALVLLGHALTIEELQESDHGVRMVVFLDNDKPVSTKTGKPVLASVTSTAGVITINLKHHFRRAVNIVLNHNTNAAIPAVFHLLIGQSYFHELNHLMMEDTPPPINLEKLPAEEQKKWKKKLKEDEEFAEEWAISSMYELAQKFDIEPGTIGECPFLAEQMSDLLSNTDEETAELRVSQKRMMENNLMLYVPPEDGREEYTIQSFKEFCHLQSGDNEDDEKWAQTVAPNQMDSLIRELGATFQHDTSQTEKVFVLDDENYGASSEVNMVGQMLGGMLGGMDEPPELADAEEYYNTNSAPTAQPAMTPTQPLQAQPSLATPFPEQTAAPTYPAMPPVEVPITARAPIPQTVAPQTITQTPTTVTPVAQYGKFSAEQVRDIVDKVYLGAFNIVFGGACEQLTNSDIGFQNPHAVEGFVIPLAPEEQEVIPSFAHVGPDGKWIPRTPTSGPGGVMGFVSKNTNLPMFKFYINDGGRELCRVVVPQNPAKYVVGTTNLTHTAQLARQGMHIMHVLDGADTPAGTPTTYILKIVDGNIVR